MKTSGDWIDFISNNADVYHGFLIALSNKSKQEQAQEILIEFNKLWSCLKFEKMSAKVIGYTFAKKDMDEFKSHLSTFAWQKRHNTRLKKERVLDKK